MRKIFEPTVGRTDMVLGWASGFLGLKIAGGGILLLALLQNPSHALSDTLPASSVTLAWDASPSPEVTGYRIYLGVASGNYTNSAMVGNVTIQILSGLAGGVTYFFAITAYDASGLESTFSNEITYTTPSGLPIVQIGMTANRQAVVTVNGLIGHSYDIQATQDFKTWTVIGTTTTGAGGSVNFTDTNAASVPQRFYRARDVQP
jgi:hypothetical protein